MERLFSRIGKNKTLNYLILGRFWNAIVAGLFSIMGIKIALGMLPGPFSTMILIAVTSLIYMGSAGLNDLFDIKTDSINMPYRPIQSKKLRLKEAVLFTVFCFLSGIVISIMVSIEYFISVLTMTLFGIMYSIHPISLKDRGILGNLALGFTTVFLTGYSGIVLVTRNLMLKFSPLLALLMLSMFFSFFSILKDFKDMTGDKFVDKGTVPIRRGARFASIINISGTSVFFLLSLSILYFLYLPHILFVITSFVLFLMILAQELKVLKNPTSRNGEISWGISRILVLLFVITILLS